MAWGVCNCVKKRVAIECYAHMHFKLAKGHIHQKRSERLPLNAMRICTLNIKGRLKNPTGLLF
jgi:hypothetical protein